MSKKKFALRLNEDTMKAIEAWAASEFRSVNGQIEWMLTQSLKNAKRFKITKTNQEEISSETSKSEDKKTDDQ